MILAQAVQGAVGNIGLVVVSVEDVVVEGVLASVLVGLEIVVASVEVKVVVVLPVVLVVLLVVVGSAVFVMQ